MYNTSFFGLCFTEIENMEHSFERLKIKGAGCSYIYRNTSFTIYIFSVLCQNSKADKANQNACHVENHIVHIKGAQQGE